MAPRELYPVDLFRLMIASIVPLIIALANNTIFSQRVSYFASSAFLRTSQDLFVAQDLQVRPQSQSKSRRDMRNLKDQIIPTYLCKDASSKFLRGLSRGSYEPDLLPNPGVSLLGELVVLTDVRLLVCRCKSHDDIRSEFDKHEIVLEYRFHLWVL